MSEFAQHLEDGLFRSFKTFCKERAANNATERTFPSRRLKRRANGTTKPSRGRHA